MNKIDGGINVISLFDGISCGQVALERAGINKSKYIASEIKPIGISVTKKNWENTLEVGDVCKIYFDKKTNSLYSNCDREVINSLGNTIYTLPEDKEEWTKEEISNFEEQGLRVLPNGEVIKYKWTKEEIKEFEKQGFEVAPSGEIFSWDLHSGTLIHDANKEGCIDMLIGGSPCQDFSAAGAFSGKSKNGEYGLAGLKSRLFYEYLRIKQELDKARKEDELPLFFFLENVHMKADSEKELNKYMGVDGIHLNSRIVSFQNRPRIYWTNIYKETNTEYKPPIDKNYSFQDFKEMPHHGEAAAKRIAEALLADTRSRQTMWDNGENIHKFSCKNVTNEDKISCLTRKQDRCPNSGLIAIDANEVKDFFVDNRKRMNCRFITKREVELAQTLPIGYLDSISYLQAQDVAGDGWTADVIAHFFKSLPEEFKKGFSLPKDKKPWNLEDYAINKK